uniref:Uncharacterized protein n=1 Tax=Candidatus Kentrum sp. SD TaxID=2126332 RepID=A0A450YZW1_9GAMM|nr:MAG: hypothetical protein BECKSD772F_GA0070984_10989 [Candidatus Kentron sp. SD]VFK47071.1 MAG: hypothetical protein BECKSD772E_GA0070983_108710 [Candidatus Kentron sp. SD]VFK79517.1 MAG: hypothetical protein BECKSD772D_GA0070982_105228 [Candidatus Kentron sp. SD]
MNKPAILLQRRDSRDSVPFDILGEFRARYIVTKRGADIRFPWIEDALDKAMNAVQKMLPEFDNVPEWKG